MEQIINYYMSENYKLYEIKYLNIPKSMPKNMRYKWFYSTLDSNEIIELEMEKYIQYPSYSIRIFKQGIFIEINKIYGFYNGLYFKNEFYKKIQ